MRYIASMLLVARVNIMTFSYSLLFANIVLMLGDRLTCDWRENVAYCQ